jgi:hypothetical protein
VYRQSSTISCAKEVAARSVKAKTVTTDRGVFMVLSLGVYLHKSLKDSTMLNLGEHPDRSAPISG